MIDLAYADADPATKPPLPSASHYSYEELEEIAKRDAKRVEDLLRSRRVKPGSYPQFAVAVKREKVAIKFQVPSGCQIPQLIANLVSNLGLKVGERGDRSQMELHAFNIFPWKLALAYPKAQKEIGVDQERQGDSDTNEGDLCIFISPPLICSDEAEIEFMKTGGFSPKVLDAFVSLLQLAGTELPQTKALERKPREGTARTQNAEKSVADLQAMGVKIYGLAPHWSSMNSEISWDNIAGYDQQKRPEVYDDIARGTRCKFESNRPRAILFEGPPGTGKTSSACVIAYQSGCPLLYVPMVVFFSKYFVESDRLLGKFFSLANVLPNGAIIFLDEVDSFVVARNGEMHKATRRILSGLLQQIEGFEQDKKVVVIVATNRKQDLDPALISRFDSMITFGLPDQRSRQEIAAQYAKHLTNFELEDFARITEHMSGRDIRGICQRAERSWAAKLIRGQANQTGELGSPPPLQEYMENAINGLALGNRECWNLNLTKERLYRI